MFEKNVAGNNKSERDAQVFALLQQSHQQSAINGVEKGSFESLCSLACFLHDREPRAQLTCTVYEHIVIAADELSVLCLCFSPEALAAL